MQFIYTDIKYVSQPETTTLPSGEQHTVNKSVAETGTDSTNAKAFLDKLGITYNWLNYADDSQHIDVFTPLNTWQFEDGQNTFNAFPFFDLYKV